MSDQVQTGFYNNQPASAQAGQLMQLMQGIRQQQLFNLQMQGQAAAGQALGGLDPSDPEYITKATRSLAQAGPLALTYGMPTVNATKQAYLAQQQADQYRVGNLSKMLDVASPVVASIMGDPDVMQDHSLLHSRMLKAMGELNSKYPDMFPDSWLLSSAGNISKQDSESLWKTMSDFANGLEPARNALKARLQQPGERTPIGGEGSGTGLPPGTIATNTNPLAPDASGNPGGAGQPMMNTFIPQGLTTQQSTDTEEVPSGTGKRTVTRGQIANNQVPGLGTSGNPTGSAAGPAGGPSINPSTDNLSPSQSDEVGIKGPTPYQIEANKDMADYKKAVDNNVQKLPTTMSQLEKLQDLLYKARTGGGQVVRNEIARMVQAIPDSLIDSKSKNDLVDTVAGGGPGAYDAALQLNKLAVQNGLSILHDSVGGESRFNEFLERTTLNNNPNSETSRGAFQGMIQFQQKLGAIANAQQQMLARYASDPELRDKVDQFPAYFNYQLQKHGVFDFGESGKSPEGPSPPSTPAMDKAADALLNPIVHTPLYKTPSPAAIATLRKNPETRKQFEQHFGPGSALDYIGD